MINKENKDIKKIVNNIADILHDADYQEVLVMIEEKMLWLYLGMLVLRQYVNIFYYYILNYLQN